jgi:hypothetical protein
MTAKKPRFDQDSIETRRLIQRFPPYPWRFDRFQFSRASFDLASGGFFAK